MVIINLTELFEEAGIYDSRQFQLALTGKTPEIKFH
jgi:hypothetical protein